MAEYIFSVRNIREIADDPRREAYAQIEATLAVAERLEKLVDVLERICYHDALHVRGT